MAPLASPSLERALRCCRKQWVVVASDRTVNDRDRGKAIRLAPFVFVYDNNNGFPISPVEHEVLPAVSQ
jgi:hypothetical protein